MSKFVRAFGIIGVSAEMANWNADFDKYPKEVGGIIIGSDKAIKYGCRYVWEQDENKTNMYFKTLIEHKEESKKKKKAKDTTSEDNKVYLRPRTLKEKYEESFGVENLEAVNDKTTVIKNLLTAVDCKNFGFTFAESNANCECTGVVQFTQGINVYDDTTAVEQPILSPFRNGKKKAESSKDDDGTGENKQSEENKQTTLGSVVLVDKAQYMYNFSVNPTALKKYVELGYTEGYTREDYEDFKKTALVAATAINTAAKAGCSNNFGVFVEVKENVYLSNLSKLVKYSYNDTSDCFNISSLIQFIEDSTDNIENVEIYYNPYNSVLEGTKELSNVKYFNIVTNKEI